MTLPSTSAVSDALDMAGLSGQVSELVALVPGARCVGPAFTVRFEDAAIPGAAPAANYIETVPPGAVVVLDNRGRTDCTVWGGLLSAFARQREVMGTVIWGVCRDLAETRALGHPMFARGTWMRTGKGRVRLAEVGGEVCIGQVEIAAGDFIVADDDGVVCVPADHWSQIEAQARIIEVAETRILEDIRSGHDLSAARRRHHYDRFRTRGSNDRD